jgi:truncated hemoglobin YjbI
MKSAHKGMGVKEADFNALVEDLTKSLDKFKVGEKEKGELLGALGGMKNDIVEGNSGSLYDRLGGKDAITAVVEDFVGNVAADKRINSFFAKTDIPNLKKQLVDQICEATGGPCSYTGKDMKTAHRGMNVSEADFNALVEDLVKSLDKFKVGEKEKGELLGALAAMKGDIVAGGGKILFDRLGGKDAIVAVVDDFVANVAADTRINKFFAKTDIPNLKKQLVDQICAATGGPCEYKGKDMKTAHKGMGVTEADFNALVEDLVKTLDKFKVGETEKGELLGALGGMKGDIVGQ